MNKLLKIARKERRKQKRELFKKLLKELSIGSSHKDAKEIFEVNLPAAEKYEAQNQLLESESKNNFKEFAGAYGNSAVNYISVGYAYIDSGFLDKGVNCLIKGSKYLKEFEKNQKLLNARYIDEKKYFDKIAKNIIETRNDARAVIHEIRRKRNLLSKLLER